MRHLVVAALSRSTRIRLGSIMYRLSTAILLGILADAYAHSQAAEILGRDVYGQGSRAANFLATHPGRELHSTDALHMYSSHSYSTIRSHYDDDVPWEPHEDMLWASGRKLMQNAVAPASRANALAPSAHGVLGQPSSTAVYTIQNNNDAAFGVYVCIDTCAHGNTCVYGNAWLWMCNGTNPTHHYFIWEPDTLIIRNPATDSFKDYPEICLEMCTDSRYGNGPCAMTGQLGTLNVGFAQCTGATNQQFTLNGTQIISKNNSQCMSAGAQPCGRWANCNKSQAQTRRDGYVINVFMEACDPNNPSQKWSLGDAPNSTILNFTPLNVSAAEYPPPVLGLASQAQANSKQVINFVSEQNPDLCLSIENQASCQSSQSPGSSTIINPLSQVCVWNNALLQTCWSGGSDAANDQSWIYDNQTKLIAYSDVNMNACLEICTTETFARGSCSLIDNNIILSQCSGAPAQQFDFLDGVLYNEVTDLCVAAKPLCMVDYTVTLSNTSAADSIVNGYRLGDCLTQVKNGPWSALPWTATNGGPLGIQNLVGVSCSGDNGNATAFFTRAAGAVTSKDPVAPGIVAGSGSGGSAGGKSNAGPIAGGVAGGAAFIIIAVAGGMAFWMARKRKAERLRMEEEFKIKMYNSGKLSSMDSDFFMQKRKPWFEGLDLGDEINPGDIEICTHPDGSEWKLGEGAFGTVYRANRFGVQPVAVKALREESSKQIENFQREIELLRGLRDNNIVLFLGVCKKDSKLMLVTEFMPGGDLWHALNTAQNSEKYTWYYRGRKIALDVARGLVHLHSREIVHMDLKSPNILLGKDMTAKIADVGLARSINNSQITQMTSIGTMAWAAPELKRNFKIGRKDGPKSLTPAADVFSYGVVLWEIVTAEDPTFSSREAKVPEECPQEIIDLIEDCLDDEPDNRPTMKEVYERLKNSAGIPPPGYSRPIATPAPTPPMSRDGSQKTPPRSNLRSGPLSGPRSGPLGQGLNMGLAAALKKKLTAAHLSGGGIRQAPKSTMRADCIVEEDEAEAEALKAEVKEIELSDTTSSDKKTDDDVADDDSAKELTKP